MSEQRVTWVNKTPWGIGAWSDEPDKVQWTDEATGLVCLAVRHSELGHWCGYVGVTEGHPAFDRHYDAVEADVHGGLTYSDFCQGSDQEHGVCHVPEPGQPEQVWWLGFDCAHSGDFSPGMRARLRDIGLPPHPWTESYRDLAYVQSECGQLAAQLAAARDG